MRSVPYSFFLRDSDNPWAGGGATIVNKEFGSEPQTVEPEPETTPEPEQTPEPTPEPSPEPTPGAEPKPEPTPEPVKDWRETANPDEVAEWLKSKADAQKLMKLAGIDDEDIKFIEFKKAGGNADEWLRIKNTDYGKLDPLKLVEMDLRERYSKLDDRQFQILLKKELQQFSLDREEYPEDSEEAILGGILLNDKADAIRQKYIDKQNSLKAPEPQPDNTAQQREQAAQQLAAQFRNSGAVSSLQANKTISIGEGEEAFNYEIKDVDTLVKAAEQVVLQNGNVPTDQEVNTILRTLAYYANPDAFQKALVDHGKILGERAVRKEAVNPAPGGQGSTPPPTPPMNDAELLRSTGTIRNKA